MIDFDEARTRALRYNSRDNTIRVLSEAEKNEVLPQPYIGELWEVETEIPLPVNSPDVIKLYLLFEPDFPLTFPKVFISKEYYQKTKYLPHVTDCNVCIVDPDLTLPNPDSPETVVEKCIKEAKKVIEKGVRKENIADFEAEFISYWEHKYEHEESLLPGFYSIIDEPIIEEHIGVVFYPNISGGYCLFLHAYGNSHLQILSAFNNLSINYQERAAFFVGDWNLRTPPFGIQYKQIIEQVKTQGNTIFSNFRKFINTPTFPKFIFSRRKVKDVDYYLGFVIYELNTNKPGFRPGIMKSYDVMSSQPEVSKYAQRILPNIFTKQRLLIRTEGKMEEKRKLNITVAGLGSIGSNLTHFLNSLRVEEYTFIDFDVLSIDNIGRHLLGFFSTGQNKAKAMSEFIQQKMPLKKIHVRPNSVVKCINEEADLINISDFIFIAIGKFNHERWINEQQMAGKIIKPVFYIWIEPYLAGGHVLYINPKDNRFGEFFNDETVFKYNIISERAYTINALFKIQEAGCNTSYTPYSSESVVSFLAAIFPKICQTMDKTDEKSWCLSWVGDTEMVSKLGIELSDIGQKNSPGSLLVY